MKCLVMCMLLVVPVSVFAQVGWTPHVVETGFLGPRSIYATDIDGDLDIDILAAATDADIIAWWANDGGSPPNFTKYIIDSLCDGANDAFATHLDSDSDVDVVGVARYANNLAWWENDGTENWTYHPIVQNLDQAIRVFAIDIDDDTDIDVLGAGASANTVIWFESDLAPGIEENKVDSRMNQELSLQISNPFNLRAPIIYQLTQSSNVQLTIYDINGKLLETLVDDYKTAGNHCVYWNAQNVSSGVYFYRLQVNDFSIIKKGVILK